MADEKIRLDKRHVLYEEHTLGYPRARRKVVLPAGSNVDAATAKKLGIKTGSKSKVKKKKETGEGSEKGAGNGDQTETPKTADVEELRAQVKEKDGGWFELPDGSKVQGTEKLDEALAQLAATNAENDDS